MSGLTLPFISQVYNPIMLSKICTPDLYFISLGAALMPLISDSQDTKSFGFFCVVSFSPLYFSFFVMR